MFVRHVRMPMHRRPCPTDAATAVCNHVPFLQEVAAAGLQEGFVNVLSRHTTTAVTINENETRLMDDVRQVGCIAPFDPNSMLPEHSASLTCAQIATCAKHLQTIVSLCARAGGREFSCTQAGLK